MLKSDCSRGHTIFVKKIKSYFIKGYKIASLGQFIRQLECKTKQDGGTFNSKIWNSKHKTSTIYISDNTIIVKRLFMLPDFIGVSYQITQCRHPWRLGPSQRHKTPTTSWTKELHNMKARWVCEEEEETHMRCCCEIDIRRAFLQSVLSHHLIWPFPPRKSMVITTWNK